MEYLIKTTGHKAVQAEEYITVATRLVMEGLEMLESLKSSDEHLAVSSMSEIVEYVESIQETIGDSEPEDYSPYAENAVEENHEHKTLRAKFLNRG